VTAAGTPPDIVAKINADIMKVVAKPDVQKRFVELGSESVTYNPVEMQKWLVDQTEYWGKVIKDNNIKLQ
jgi:tripartite-type tricarboxylate transporter receptor subunit TctC